MNVETLVLGEFETNCYIVTSEGCERALIVDAPAPAQAVIEYLRGTSLMPELLVITHAHFDHIAGIPDLKDSFPELEMAASHTAAGMLGRPTMNLSLFLGQGRRYAQPEVYMVHGGTVSGGGVDFEVIGLDGHAPGSICLLGRSERAAIFTGDTLFAGGVGRTDLPGGNRKELMAGIQRDIMCLAEDTIVYPGHGPKTTVGAERDNPFLSG